MNYSAIGTEVPRLAEAQQKRLNVGVLYNKLEYFPHPKQLSVHAAGRGHRFRVVCAGRRWGKSHTGPMDNIPKLLLKEPTLGWIVAPTYDLGEKEFRVFWRVLTEQLQVPIDKTKTFNSIRTKSFRITTAWGSTVEVRSAEHPESLVGEGLDWVIMAEAAKLKLSHWEKYIRPTLADKRGTAIFVSTPEGFNWFHDLFQLGQNTDHHDWWSLQSPSWDNPYVFPEGRQSEEILSPERTLSREVFEQEYGAEFTSFAGRIYSEFDEGYHVLDKYEFNPAWQNFCSFDFGFRNPFVCLQIQVDDNDNVYVWDEYYERQIITVEHAKRLKSQIQWRVDKVYYDPSGVDEATTIEREWHDRNQGRNFNLMNSHFEPAPNEWKPGVERVKQWLKIRDENNGLGPQPKLFVSRNCRNTIREFNTYRVKEQSETVSERKDAKDEPRKKDDHAMDALRYFIAGHFGFETHYGYVV